MKAEEAFRMKEIDIENVLLKRAVAGLAVDNQIPKDASKFPRHSWISRTMGLPRDPSADSDVRRGSRPGSRGCWLRGQGLECASAIVVCAVVPRLHVAPTGNQLGATRWWMAGQP
jgi:hypothetical protein